jgi:peptidoglycan/xylan/chitin deacetylase (PgdA/CDA1 family)
MTVRVRCRAGRVSALAAVVLTLAACSPAGAPASQAAPTTTGPATTSSTTAPLAKPSTVVTLTFDDGTSDHFLIVGELLRQRNLRATFYVPSGLIDKGGKMSWVQVGELARFGNDIGGHTRDHVRLVGLPLAQAREQVCSDRQQLIREGFDPVSFAYPEGSNDQRTVALVKKCGYPAARSAGGIFPQRPIYAERIPPENPYAIRTLPAEARTHPIRLAYLQNAVTAAATHGGGWLLLVFHHVCDRQDPEYAACMGEYAPIDSTTLDAFLDWLQHDAPAGVAVKTVAEVMGAA